ncbi:MAG TPA: hypothetical protein VFM38_00630 [Candidatus Limnocylindrales bacterium]|nr:hypothetical protein [Candidatus Limnocylindrales bacterium]
MSSEPARRPEDDDEPLPTAETTPPDAPAADEALPPDAEAPVPNPDAGLTAEAAASAEAAAAAEAMPSDGAAGTPADTGDDPVEREAAVMTADAQAAETTAEAVATIDAASDDAAAEAKAAEDAKAERRAARRRAVGGAVKTLLSLAIGVVLLVGGIALGNYIFNATRPAPMGLTGDPGTNLQNPSPAAQEFIAALAVNDADSIRSSLDREPHIDLTNEMTKYGIQHVDSVDVLGTSVDGPRSATEILMHYQREDGIPFAINLVILVNDGKIEGFR